MIACSSIIALVKFHEWLMCQSGAKMPVYELSYTKLLYYCNYSESVNPTEED